MQRREASGVFFVAVGAPCGGRRAGAEVCSEDLKRTIKFATGEAGGR